jgi:hypothetical protein
MMNKTVKSFFVVAITLTLSLSLTPAYANVDITPKKVGKFTVVNVTKMLQSLTVEPESTATYSRTAFKHWTDANKDCFNTRAEVLKNESFKPTTNNSSCTILTGEWYSPYDNLTFTDASKLDVDHVVALKEAWDSGADKWSAKTREAFANDLKYRGSLIAVSAGSNRSKSDKDIAQWLPTNKSYHCTYVATWVSVKWRWSLSIDQAEKTAINKALQPCKSKDMVKPKS